MVNRKNYYWLLLITGLSLACFQSFGRQSEEVLPYVVKEIPEYIEGFHTDHLEVLEDPEGIFTFEEVKHMDFRKMPERKDAKFDPNKTYWGKISIVSALERHTDWMFYVGFDNIIELYVPDDIGNYVRKVGGQYAPSSQKEIIEGRVSPFKLSLPPHKKVTVYVRVQNFNHRSPNFYLALVKPEYWHKRLERRNLLEGLFNGVLLIMIFYNLFLFFSNRDRTYLYYSLYILHVGGYFFVMKGFSREFILGDFPISEPYVWAVALGLSPVFYFQFIRHYLHTETLVPRWDRYIRYAIAVSLTALCIELLILYFSFDIELVGKFSVGALILEAIFSLALLWRFVRTKSKLAYYLVAGSLCLWTGGIIAIIYIFSSYFFDALVLGQIGVVLELLIFSLGLGYRMKLDKVDKKKAQHELILQLKENETMQAEANKRLEEKVIERTKEIRHKNQKLEQQKEEIAVQKENMGVQNQQLEKANSKLTALNEEKNLLIGIVAHDLRNPLTSAMSMTQLLQSESESLDEDVQECTQVLGNSLKRMNHMIEHILDLNAIEAEELNLDWEELPLANVITDVVDSFQEKARQKDITLLAELHPCTITADEGYLMQVVENLISNAIKFSPTGKEVRVTLRKEETRWVNIEVQDQGPGISSEDQKKLFLKYQKLSAKPTAGEKSTGLGLSIVKKYVEAMQGEIWCKSALQQGATFVIQFPATQKKPPI